MLTTITNAIATQSRLSINYDPGIRIIEPHAIGYSKDGNILIRAYQTEGVSASGEHENWKLFRLDRLVVANDNGQHFNGPRPDYKKGDKAMKGGIIAEL